MQQNHISKLKDQIKFKSFDKDQKIKACKAILLLGMKEMIRQVGIQCSERGELLQSMISSFSEVCDCSLEKLKTEFKEQLELCQREINLLKFENAKIIDSFQNKLDFVTLEKKALEKNEAKYLKKIQDLQKILETTNFETGKLHPSISITSSPIIERLKLGDVDNISPIMPRNKSIESNIPNTFVNPFERNSDRSQKDSISRRSSVSNIDKSYVSDNIYTN